eukprot:scaffold278302_cov30-Attheya_sp.AAC.1
MPPMPLDESKELEADANVRMGRCSCCFCFVSGSTRSEVEEELEESPERGLFEKWAMPFLRLSTFAAQKDSFGTR